ncbi:MAG: phosphodiesterase, family [Gemmatimonadetes bacterium]|nr:phosphodiesterase, family [Gemmatimonadota bacterium]
MGRHGARGVTVSTRRIGLISDTHGLLRPEVFGVLEGVELILHAGDVGDGVLAELSAIAPVRAVAGNTDWADESLEKEVELEIDGVSIHVSHGHELGMPTPAKLLEAYPHQVVMFGHTHRQVVVREGNRIAVNPGAAGARRFNLLPSCGVLTIAKGIPSVALTDLPG